MGTEVEDVGMYDHLIYWLLGFYDAASDTMLHAG